MVSVHASHIRQISQNASSLFHIGSICIHWMYSYIRFFIKVNRKLEFHKYLHGDLSKESIYLNTNFQPNWAILKKKIFSRTLSISGQHTAYIRNFSRSFSKCVDIRPTYSLYQKLFPLFSKVCGYQANIQPISETFPALFQSVWIS